MLRGQINIEDDAIVEITLMFKDKFRKEKAVVDTGFNGYLSMPKKLIKQSAWYEFGEEEYELATGQIVRESVYLGKVLFNRKKRDILAVQTNGHDILIGTKLLSGYLCEFDYGSRILIIRKGNVLHL